LFEVAATPQLSEVDGVPKVLTVAEHNPASEFTLIAEGHAIVGLLLSVTATVNVQEDVLPAPSVAVKVTVVFPTVTEAPAAGLCDKDTLTQLSFFVASDV